MEEEIREIDVETFMNLFVAVRLRNEQRTFNIVELDEYLSGFAPIDSYEALSQIWQIATRMVDEGLLVPNDRYPNVLTITNKVDFINIIRNNIEYLPIVDRFVEDELGKGIPSIKLVLNKKQK